MSSSSVFPLLKLPYLCIECILCNAEVLDLVSFSLLSKKCHQLVECVNTCVMGVDLVISRELSKLKLVRTDNRTYGELIFHFDSPNENMTPQISLNRYIDSSPVDNSKHVQFDPFISNDLQESFKSSVYYFMDLFKCGVDYAQFDLTNIQESRCRSLLDYDTFDYLEIISNESIENEKLKEIFENVTVKQNLRLDIPIEPGFHCDSAHFQMERIIVRYSHWVTRDFLFDLKASEIGFDDCDLCKINGNDFLEFVDRWYHSDNQKFKVLKMQWTEKPGAVDLDKYNPIEWDDERRSGHYVLETGFQLNLEQDQDIQRSDGRWATIATRTNELIFCVWHDLFPKERADVDIN